MFEYLDELLKGVTVVEMLAIYFEILNKFKIIQLGLHVMFYASCIDFEILIKEMMYYDIPSELQWKEIVRLCKTKCNFPVLVNDHPAVNKVWVQTSTNQIKSLPRSKGKR